MKYLVYAAGLVAISAPAHAENWRSAQEYDGYPAVITYVDTDSIVRSGGTVEFIYREFVEGDGGSAANNFVQRRSVNCSANTYHILSHQAYDGATPKGSPTQDLSTRAAVADTADRRVQNAVCNNSYLTGTVSDPAYDAEDFFYYLDGW